MSEPQTLYARCSELAEKAGLRPFPPDPGPDEWEQVRDALHVHLLFFQVVELQRLVAALQRSNQLALDGERINLENPPV